MRFARVMAVLILGSLISLAVACGGDDDSPAATSTSGAPDGDAEPTATVEAGDTGEPAATATTEDANDGGGTPGETTVGSITVGDETWDIVANGERDFDTETAPPLSIVSIVGHAFGDDSIEIIIHFDPRDTGLLATIEGAGGEPSWSAINETLVVSVGAISMSGEGSFSNSAGAGETEGSLSVLC